MLKNSTRPIQTPNCNSTQILDSISGVLNTTSISISLHNSTYLGSIIHKYICLFFIVKAKIIHFVSCLNQLCQLLCMRENEWKKRKEKERECYGRKEGGKWEMRQEKDRTLHALLHYEFYVGTVGTWNMNDILIVCVESVYYVCPEFYFLSCPLPAFPTWYQNRNNTHTRTIIPEQY